MITFIENIIKILKCPSIIINFCNNQKSEKIIIRKKNKIIGTYENIHNNLKFKLLNQPYYIYIVIDNMILDALIICINKYDFNISESQKIPKEIYYLNYERYGYNEYILLKAIINDNLELNNKSYLEGYLYRNYLPKDYENTEIIDFEWDKYTIKFKKENDYYHNSIGNWIYHNELNYFEFRLESN